MDQSDLARARAALPGLANCTYLNVGTYGIMAQPVLDQLLALVTQSELTGSIGYQEVGTLMRQTRKRLATLLGCDAEELAFTENATHGLNLPAFGLPFTSHDVVLLSSEEYPICEWIYRYREQNGGPHVQFFTLSHDPEETLSNLDAVWDDHVKCVMFSGVTCETAVRLPTAEMCRMARERKAWSVVDLAQAIGQFPINLRELGCDFAIGSGHKWLYGPKGVGLFYARKETVTDLAPPWVSHTASFDPITQEVTVPKNRRRFELVARPYAIFAGMTPALEWLESFGWESLWQHMAEMRELICREAEKRRGVRILSPRKIQNSSSLVTLRIPGVEEKNVEAYVETVWKRERIYLRASSITGGVRLSAAYFTNEEDISRFFAYLDAHR